MAHRPTVHYQCIEQQQNMWVSDCLSIRQPCLHCLPYTAQEWHHQVPICELTSEPWPEMKFIISNIRCLIRVHECVCSVHLFISNIFSIKAYWWFHCKQRYCLQHMTVNNVTDNPITTKIPTYGEKGLRRYHILFY